MLNEKQIRYMSRLAMYDRKQAKKDMRIAKFYRKDYAGFQTLITAIDFTFGYLLIVSLFMLCSMDDILNHFTMEKLAPPLFLASGLYLVLLAAYCAFGYSFFKKRHQEAKKRLKNYYRRLSHLEKMRVKEKG